MSKRSLLADEIFERLQNYSRHEMRHALDVCARLSRKENVSDGDLVDALHTLTTNLDLNNPLLVLNVTMIQRFMLFAGIEETPRGVRREWFTVDDTDSQEPSR